MKALESLGYVTPRDYTAFVKFNLLKGRYYRLKVALCIFAISAVCISLAVCGIAYWNKTLLIVAGAILLCCVMFVYTLNVNVKRVCNSNTKAVRAQQKAVFGKNGFIFEMLFKDEAENERDEIFYDELDLICVAPRAIYLYVEQRSVIILPYRNLNMSRKDAEAFLTRYAESHKLIVCA